MSKVEIVKRPVEQVGKDIKRSAWTAVIESLALIILGILFITLQGTIVQVLAYIIGVFFIIKGIYQTINYFVEKGQEDFFNNGLLTGVVSILIGVAALVVGEDIANIFRIIIGIIIIYESLVRVNTSIKLSHAGIPAWRYILLLAILMLMLGIFITFNTGAVIVLVGWLMIATGVIGIIGDAIFIQYVNTIVDKLTK